jgi:predicted MFS family arabinose efflux permease
VTLPDLETVAQPVVASLALDGADRLRALRALRHPTFRVIWISTLVTQLGLWISTVGMQWLVVVQSGGNPAAQGFLLFITIAPMAVLSPVAGALADRFDRRRVMVIAQLAISGTAVVLAVASAFQAPLPLILGLAGCLGAAAAFGGPVSQAVIGDAVPARDIASAVSLQSVAFNLSRMIGPALAAPILAIWGVTPAFAIYGIAAAASAAVLSRLNLKAYTRSHNAHRIGASLIEGFQHAKERQPALVVLTLAFGLAACGASYFALIPVFASRVLGQQEQGFAALVVATGVGAAVGALTSGFRENASRILSLVAWLLAVSIALAAFSLSPSLLVALPLVALFGGLYFASLTRLQSTLQYLVADHSRGRVMSLFVVAMGGVPLGGLVAGGIAETLGTAHTMLLFSVVLATFGTSVGLYFRIRPQLEVGP